MPAAVEQVQDQQREARLRRAARRQGFVLRKSRLRGEPNIDNFGGYMIVDAYRNWAVAGLRFDFTLDDVEEWLRG